MKPTSYSIYFLLSFICANVDATEISPPLRLVLDQPPLTLNPRQAIDANSQRLGALLYRGLTRLDASLNPTPDLAVSWRSSNQQKKWVMTLAPSENSKKIAACMEEYRAGQPRSVVGAAFRGWTSTTAISAREVEFQFKESDPYFSRNATLLRYFENKKTGRPCSEPETSSDLAGTGPLKIESADVIRNTHFLLSARDPHYRPLEIFYVKDELSRLFMLLGGEADAAMNGVSISKTHWLATEAQENYSTQCWDFSNVQYLGFQLKHPILSKIAVRKAISMAIDRSGISTHKYFGITTPAFSFIPTQSPEYLSLQLPFNIEEAKKTLDQAGFPILADGFRFHVKYLTTPMRDGFELAQIIQNSLRAIQIDVSLEAAESALFFDRLKKGKFELYSSRWVGVADGSIFFRTLDSQAPTNRVGYRSPVMDRWIQAIREKTGKEQREAVFAAQRLMLEDLPYAPLWRWQACYLQKRALPPLDEKNRSISGALDILARISFSP